MIWSILFDLILVGLVIHICLPAFRYVKVSLFHNYLIPVYSLVMFLITMKWNHEDLVLFVVLALLAIALGLLETAGMKFRKRPSRKNRSGWSYEIYRGWPYIVGWVLVILIGFGMSIWMNHATFFHLFEDKVFETVFEDINPLSFFFQEHPWYIWLLSSVSSLTFTIKGTHSLKMLEANQTIEILQESEEEAPKAFKPRAKTSRSDQK